MTAPQSVELKVSDRLLGEVDLEFPKIYIAHDEPHIGIIEQIMEEKVDFELLKALAKPEGPNFQGQDKSPES